MRVASHARGRGAEGVDWRRNAPGAEPLPEHRLAADRGSAGLERGERGAAPMRRRFDARPARGGVLPSIAGCAGSIGNRSHLGWPYAVNEMVGHPAQLRDGPAGHLRELRDGDLHATPRRRLAGWRRERTILNTAPMYQLGTSGKPPPPPSASHGRRSADRMAARAAQSRAQDSICGADWPGRMDAVGGGRRAARGQAGGFMAGGAGQTEVQTKRGCYTDAILTCIGSRVREFSARSTESGAGLARKPHVYWHIRRKPPVSRGFRGMVVGDGFEPSNS